MELKSEGHAYTRRQRLMALLLGAGIAAFFFILRLLLNLDAITTPFDNNIYGTYYRLRNQTAKGPIFEKYYDKMTYVIIDDESLKELNLSWPIPRSVYAELLDRLVAGEAKAVGFDILFLEPAADPKQDQAFARSLARSGDRVVMALNLRMDEKQDENGNIVRTIVADRPIPAYIKALGRHAYTGQGYVSYEEDPQKVVKWVRLAYDVKEGTREQRLYPFDLHLISLFTGIKLDTIRQEGEHLVFGPYRIPIDPQRIQTPVNFGFRVVTESGAAMSSGFEKQTLGSQFIDTIPLWGIMQMDPSNAGELQAYFKDRMVIVGVTATAGYDIKTTPVGLMGGMYVHGNLILSILNQKFLADETTNLPLSLAFLFIPALLMGAVLPRVNPKIGGGIAILFFAAVLVLPYYLFTALNPGILMAVFIPLLNVVLCFAAITLYHFIAEQRTSKRFGQLLKEFAPMPAPWLDQYLASGQSRTGGQKTNISILFSDIRGYTDLSERLDPVEVMNTLNEYHAAMGNIFEENGGVIYDYQGDAQMVVFGLADPSTYNHGFYAVRAALSMQAKLDEMRKVWIKEGRHTFEIGVGICTGDVSLGVVGSAYRKQYAAIGDATNTAARLQGMSKTLEAPVLISEPTFEMAQEFITADKLPPVTLKGKREPVPVYRATGVRTDRAWPGQERKKNK